MRTNFVILPANIYLFKISNISTRKWYELSSKLTIKTPERRQWRRSSVFIIGTVFTVSFEHTVVCQLGLTEGIHS